MSSSQALTISILGNLAIHNKLDCLSDLKDENGDSIFGNSVVCLDNFSMEYKIKHLGEPRSTSLDGYISGDYHIAIECKFTELEFGTCSRPRLTEKDNNFLTEYCNGSLTIQNGRINRCSLTEIGVSYWKYIPDLFEFWDGIDWNICPMNKNYQLYRNILAIGVSEDGKPLLTHGHAILIYDEQNPAFHEGGKGYVSFHETKRILKNQSMLRKFSWQQILKHLRGNNILPWLTDQVFAKYGM